MKLLSTFAIVGAAVGGCYFFAASHAVSSPVPIHLEPVFHAAFDAEAIERNIAFHSARVKRDPKGAIGWAMLADAYLAKSREYDNDKAAWKAEETARKSLFLRTQGNERAKSALVASLLEQHRFQDALHTLDGFGVDRGRLRADVLIEMGEYKKATALLDMANQDDPSVVAARARIALLQGKSEIGAGLLQKARKMTEANAAVGQTTLAWYDVKLGDALSAMGKKVEARQAYESALSFHPRSYKAHLALARLNLSEKQWSNAILEGQTTMKIANSLDARAVIGDAYAGMGDKAQAATWYKSCEEQFKTEVATFDQLGKGGPFRVRPIDRQFATFASGHRMYTAEAIPAAKRDLANRPDPHAHEVLQVLETN